MNMNKKFSLAITLMALKSSTVLANYGDPLDIKEGVESVMPTFNDGYKTLGGLLIFIAVIMVGINIILNRGKAEERQNAMSGLMYIAIGSFICGMASVIYSYVISLNIN